MNFLKKLKNIENLEETVNAMKLDLYIDFKNYIDDFFEKAKTSETPLTVMIDDTYVLVKNLTSNIWRKPNNSFHKIFFVEGISVNPNTDEINKAFHKIKHFDIGSNIDIIDTDTFSVMLETMKQKCFLPTDENVNFQFSNSSPYFFYDTLYQEYPDFFNDEYIIEFFNKLNIKEENYE